MSLYSWCRMKWIFDPTKVVLLQSGFLLVYYLFFGIIRSGSIAWNGRPSEMEDFNWMADPLLLRIHEKLNKLENASGITIVTAYFDLGKFQKGNNDYRSDIQYKRWLTVLRRIRNPVIMFTDSTEMAESALKLRDRFPEYLTRVRKVAMADFWSFRIAPRIQDVFDQTDYPRHLPNTVNSNYSSCMHVKFELLQQVITENIVNTKYISWMDIGLFRHVLWETDDFTLNLPDGFDETKVTFNQVFPRSSHVHIKDIITENLVWVGGGLALGRTDIMLVFTQDYMKSVNQMLDLKWMSTDQQVIYSMFLPDFPIKPRVEIQVYSSHSELFSGDWFHAANLMKDVSDKIDRRSKCVISQLLQYL